MRRYVIHPVFLVLLAAAVIAGGSASRGMVWCMVDGSPAAEGARLEMLHGTSDCTPAGHGEPRHPAEPASDGDPTPAPGTDSNGCTDLDFSWLALRAADSGDDASPLGSDADGGQAWPVLAYLLTGTADDPNPGRSWPPADLRDDADSGRSWREGPSIRINL